MSKISYTRMLKLTDYKCHNNKNPKEPVHGKKQKPYTYCVKIHMYSCSAPAVGAAHSIP